MAGSIARIRCGRGLGDSIYLYAVVRHLVAKGIRLEVCSDWPDVFRALAGKVSVVPFTRANVKYLAHYASRKAQKTKQFEDCCINAGITEPVDLVLDWSPVNMALVERLRGVGKPVIYVQLPRAPMGRTDGFGREILPDCRRIQAVIDRIGSRAYFVQVGKGKPLFDFTGIDLDLANQTTVSDVIDIGYASDAFLGYCSYMVALAEALNKPELVVWSRKGLKAIDQYIARITPQKILQRESSRFVIDDCSDEQLCEAADALLGQAGG